MQIKLKNGVVVQLRWNWLVIERLEGTVGPIDSLDEKNIRRRGQSKTMGDIAYAVVQSNIDTEMTRNELLSLIDFNDIKKISHFVAKNTESTNEFNSKKNFGNQKKNHQKK